MNNIQMLNLILILIVGLIVILGLVLTLIILKMKNDKTKQKQSEIVSNGKVRTTEKKHYITRDGKEIDSIYKFMEFEGIKDNMIIRKNRKQYVMVIECKGINYDLLSEEEKEAVEDGFTEFLNALRYPIQLYIQTRKIDFSKILKEYSQRTQDLSDQIERLNAQIEMARNNGNTQLVARLSFEKKRKENILEYGESIENYTADINDNKDMLQKKMYIVLSYYSQEIGDISKYSNEEIDDLAFSELYTRAQTLIRAISSSEITGEVLSSEELAQLLYVAYNRDESEKYTLEMALDAQYDRLYSTSKDTFEERKKKLKEKVNEDANKLATKSLLKADEILRQESKKHAMEVREKAREIVEGYKASISDPLYNEAVNQINISNDNQINGNTQIRKVARK